jgi:acetyl-CoA carboxylase carboxyl transferase subunit beta
MLDTPETQHPLLSMSQVERPSRRGVPEGLWLRCPSCAATVFRKDVVVNLNVCPDCDHHFYVSARDRLTQLLDENSFEEWDADLKPVDVLEFVDNQPYSKRIIEQQRKTGMNDAAVCGSGFIRGRSVVIGITDFAFMAGSMGGVVGEKLTRAAERATEYRRPLIFVSGSGGGARMQEGILSLMQMAKVSAALARYHQAGGLYVCILTNPTMGGVAASWAFQGDVTLAEPKAMIGFAGARTIKNTIRLELPDGFQTSEFLLQHGFVDRIVPRREIRTAVSQIIDYCEIR